MNSKPLSPLRIYSQVLNNKIKETVMSNEKKQLILAY